MALTGAHRRRDVQGLRAVAILYVLAFHAGLPWDGGFTGVDVFFVISGFVITGVLLREETAIGRIDLWRFFGRRVKRLLPALAVMIVVVALLAILFAPAGAVHDGPTTGVFSALFSGNAWIYHLQAGYFEDASGLNPFLHTWTLGVEEQFYVGFSTVLVAGFALAPGGRLTWVPVALVAAVSAASLALAFGAPEDFAFYGSPSRAWEFGAGALIALLATGVRRLPAALATVLAVLGAAGLIAAGFVVDGTQHGTAASALLPVAATAALITAGTAAATAPTRVLSVGPLVWIGNLSYSWYLWHWPFIVFAAALFPADGDTPRTVAAVVSIAPAWLSLRYVENPVRRNPRIRGRRIIGLAAVCILVPIAACLGWRAANSYLTDHSERLAAVDASHRFNAGEARGCYGPYLPPPARPECTWRAPGAEGAVVLVGDSVAATLTEPVVAAANANGYNATVASRVGCPFVELQVQGRLDALRSGCVDDYRTGLRNLLATRPALVVMTATSSYVSDPALRIGPPDGVPAASAAAKQQVFRAALTATMAKLNDAGIPVLVIKPTPYATRHPDECAALRLLTHGCHLDRPRSSVERERAGVVAAENAAVAGAERAAAVDPVDVLCDRATCPTIKDGRVLYRAHLHVGAAGARLLTGHVSSAIRSLVGQ